MATTVEAEFLTRMHWTVHTHFQSCTTRDWSDSDNDDTNEAGAESPSQELDQRQGLDAGILAHTRSPFGVKTSVIAKTSTRTFKGSKKFFSLRKKGIQATG